MLPSENIIDLTSENAKSAYNIYVMINGYGSNSLMKFIT